MLSEIKQDRWERRGFLRTGALAFLNLKNVTLRLAWQAAGKQLPVDIEEVFSFTRQANTFAIAWYVEHGRHATRDEVFGKMVEHREHFKPGSWMSHLNPFSDEIFTGWFLDYANVTRGYPRRINDADEVNDGYRLIVRGESYCIITDESGVIYQAHTPKQVPTAATLDS